ncbi:unnamed protein product [Meloidogyne enterolobii]|uniref:Uncharacterized protein n=1 Tax=Meloidogyne enterolobii TaxID=390850 RepID=A0ACB0XKD6_MELEN
MLIYIHLIFYFSSNNFCLFSSFRRILIKIFLIINIFKIPSTSPLNNFENQKILFSLEISDLKIKQFISQLYKESLKLDVFVNFQGHTNNVDRIDRAKEPLFRDVNLTKVLLLSESVPKLLKLYDNYEPFTGRPEIETIEEKNEIKDFLDVIIKSRPMDMLYTFLKSKDHPIAKNQSVFRHSLEQLWFGQYSRSLGQPDSSGFEHVFIGEFKQGIVSGLHNWIRFLYLEKNKNNFHFDYKGYLIKRGNIFGVVKFSWEDLMKPAGSFLIGTTPDFEFALYTFCFLSRRLNGKGKNCNFELDGCQFTLISYELVQQGRLFIGSMYPSAGQMTNECRRSRDLFT